MLPRLRGNLVTPDITPARGSHAVRGDIRNLSRPRVVGGPGIVPAAPPKYKGTPIFF
ncbi:hypothetical protein GCM10022222_84820 [Amycolatopsis ultiminotia]|uniref:Uncharacterized protein n=1 Tax=Amycolatopsis ultiminotia TaxID=543629 RepID=A0ABP6YNU6_9PSEU